MRKFKFSIFLLVLSISVSAQWKACWLFNYTADDASGSYDGAMYNSASYYNGALHYVEGSHAADFDNSNAYFSTTSTMDMTGTDGLTIVLNYYVGTGTGNSVLLTNRSTFADTGFSIEVDRTNLRIDFQTDAGASEGDAYSANNSYTANTLTWCGVRLYNRTGANATIWINGVKSGTDTVAIEGFGVNDNIVMGTFEDGNMDSYGYIDNVQIYDFAATDAQMDSLYDNRSSSSFYITEFVPDLSLNGGSILENQSIQSGEDVAAFSSVSSASGGSGSYTYYWKYSSTTNDPEATGWTNIYNNTLTYDPGSQTATTYWCRVVYDGAEYAYSNVLTVTVQTSSENASPSSKLYPFYIIQGDQICHDQEFIVPDDVTANGDYVGKVAVNVTDAKFYDGGEDYVFSILSGNTGNAFLINDTGLIRVNTNTAIDYGSDYALSILITDTIGLDRSDTIIATIHVTYNHADSTKFADLDTATNGSGTFLNPYNKLEGIVLSAGQTLYIKNGTTSMQGDQLYITNLNSPTKWIRVGTYGQGSSPVIDGTGSTHFSGVYIGGDNTGYPTQAQKSGKIKLYGLKIINYTASGKNGFYSACGNYQIEVRRFWIVGSNDNGCFYSAKQYTDLEWCHNNNIIQDSRFESGISHNLKLEGGGWTVTNCSLYNAYKKFISNPWSANNKFYYIYGYNSNTSGMDYDCIEFRNSQCELRWFYLENCYAIQFTQPLETYHSADSNKVSDGFIETKATSAFYTSYDANGTLRADTIQRVIIRTTSTSSLKAINFAAPNSTTNPLQNFVINSCIIDDPDWYINIYVGNSQTSNLKIMNNLMIHDATSYGVFFNSGSTGNKIYNNTVYGNAFDFVNNSGNNIDFRNNSYVDRSGSNFFPSTNNYVFSSGDPYHDRINNDYYPALGSGIIDAGLNGYRTNDILGYSIIGTDEIGAFQYFFITPGINRYVRVGGRLQLYRIGERKQNAIL